MFCLLVCLAGCLLSSCFKDLAVYVSLSLVLVNVFLKGHGFLLIKLLPSLYVKSCNKSQRRPPLPFCCLPFPSCFVFYLRNLVSSAGPVLSTLLGNHQKHWFTTAFIVYYLILLESQSHLPSSKMVVSHFLFLRKLWEPLPASHYHLEVLLLISLRK